ncbi:MAG: ATP-binding protein [Bacteroidetes bacterium]|nr:ATP-binding protein [Bacteroidota bacterium]MBL7103382.1 ATP-binding protein [Bacteroidales bacterium]
MTEITILSGKGGTGKTSITVALASLVQNTVFSDCDVEAADMFLIFEPEISEEFTFESGAKAIIEQDKCNCCGKCYDVCRFDAIFYNEDGGLEINPLHCEGCRLCERICPVSAITMLHPENNKWFISESRFGPLIYARMGPGEENSGKLVTTIRKKAKEIAEASSADFIINDGPPGIGCPVISSLIGIDKALLVIEPTKPGLHDILRLIELIEKFKMSAFAIINKYDISETICLEVERKLKELNIPLIGKIPFDEMFTEAMVNRKSVVEYAPNSVASKVINQVWDKLKQG